jgi:hypothetical protein
LIGPVIMLVVVPAVQTFFLGRDRPASPPPAPANAAPPFE